MNYIKLKGKTHNKNTTCVVLKTILITYMYISNIVNV